MTPAERDEVRRRASDRLADHSMATVTSDERCACDRCDDDRAVLRYVPPGDATAPAGFTLQPVAATADAPASVVTVSPKGRFWPLDVEMARQMGAAYLAAADAAEES